MDREKPPFNTVEYGIDSYGRGYWVWSEMISHFYLNVPTTSMMLELDTDCQHSPTMAFGAALYALYHDGIVMIEMGGKLVMWEKTPSGFVRETNMFATVFNTSGSLVAEAVYIGNVPQKDV